MIVDILFILRECECRLPILFFEQPAVFKWDLDGNSFKETVAEWIKLALLNTQWSVVVNSIPSRCG